MNRKIIGVQFQSKKSPSSFGDREYTYYAEDDYSEGDIIKVPTRRGATTGRVCRTNIPPEEVNPSIQMVTIPKMDGAEPEIDEMDLQIAEVWDRIEYQNPDISTEQLFDRVEDETGCDASDIAADLFNAHNAKED